MFTSPDHLRILRQSAKDEAAFQTLLELFHRSVAQASAFLQAEIDAMDAEVAVLDPQGVVIAVNAAWRRYADQGGLVSSNYGLGVNYLNVCEEAEGADADAAQRAASSIRQVMTGELEESTFDYPCHTPHREQWFSMSIKRFVLDHQAYIVIAHYDITHRVQAEQQLQHNQALYELLVRNLPHNAVFLFDRNLRYTFAEGEGIRAAGRSPEDFIGKTLADLFPPEVAERDEITLRAALDGHTTTVEVPFEDRWYYVQTIPVRDKEGEIVGGMVVTQDITLWKQAETMRAQKENLERALEKEREINHLKTWLMGRIDHEFRTPLSVIQSSTDILDRYQDRMTEAMRHERIKQVHEEIQHLTRLLNDVSLMIKAQSNKLALRRVEFDMVELCEEVIRDVSLSMDTQQRFVSLYEPALAIEADRGLLKSVLVNLISNAVKYSAQETEIHIQLARKGETVVLHVIDQGIEISEDELIHIFEPFYRAANAQHVNGMGLGLSIVKEIIDLHRGALRIRSTLGKGQSSP